MIFFGKDNSDLIKAADLIKQGELIAFPTETIYGLGADATNETAVRRVFHAKGRPNFNPLIAHVSSIEMAKTIAEIDDRAMRLIMLFWPGPLTLILKKKPNTVCDALTAGLDTVAVRMPANDVALKLIENAGVPIAAPSANKSGCPSPTEARHVIRSFDNDMVSGVVNGGRTKIGLESTILDLTSENPEILRHGFITAEDIQNKLLMKVEESTTPDKKGKVKSPGQLLRHYAPSLPVRLNVKYHVKQNEALIAFGKTRLKAKRVINLSPTKDLKEAAHNLFAALIELDEKDLYSGIAVMPIPNKGIGVAINDKLKRASSK